MNFKLNWLKSIVSIVLGALIYIFGVSDQIGFLSSPIDYIFLILPILIIYLIWSLFQNK